jgi:hypothetical protein
MKSTAIISILAASLVLFGCGDDDSNSNSGNGGADKPQQQQQQQAQGAAGCVESWNAAVLDVRAKGSLSHRGDEPKDIYIGTYSGPAFTESGDGYDAAGSMTSADLSIAPGDCVAVDRTGSNDEETNWVMVAPKANGGGKTWWFIGETEDHPLAKSPQPLEGEAVVGIAGLEDPKLSP